MLLDPMGGVVITNDGNCILREVDVSHPTAKSMIELSRAQDEEVGDGTTSVIILSGEMLILAEPLIHDNLHPTVIVQGYNRALNSALDICEELALEVDIHDTEQMKKLVQSCIGTKFSSRWNDKMVEMALQAVLTVAREKGSGGTTSSGSSSASNPYNHKVEVDIKRYAKVEKIPGGEISDSTVLKGVMFNKDTTHSKMRRNIKNPRILLLDCPLEYKKGESQTNVEITNTDDWNTMLRMEEEYVENMCMEIITFQPDIVITEKGVSDLAQHYLAKANITAFRRLRKTDNNRVARATGATIVSRTDEIQESDIGTGCGTFDMKKLGDEVRMSLI
jgi:T-complex protein 1 subunit gamma